MEAIAQWWDSVELWLTGLPFVLQVSLVLVVLAVIAIVVVRVLSALIDGVGDLWDARVRSHSGGDDAGSDAVEGMDKGV